jgi:hypothetical protein
MRILKSHPLLKLVNSYLIDASEPSNISYLWNFGSLLALCLIIQIITGVTLAMHYSPNVLEAFNSIEHIMRDVNNGWLIRYLHANTASAFFFLVVLNVDFVYFSLCNPFFTLNKSCTKNPAALNSCIALLPLYTTRKHSRALPFILRIHSRGMKSLSPLTASASKTAQIPNPQSLDSLSNKEFDEWFRGFVDAEGCFSIQTLDNRFKLIFTLCLHIDETPLIKYIAQRLGIGNISLRDSSVNYTVSSKDALLVIFGILDKTPLNTSKNLNYIMFRQAYDLYFYRESTNIIPELCKEIIALKEKMNKNRVEFKQPIDHVICITPYWLLGFVEGEGYFSTNKTDYSLRFGIGQTSQEIGVLEAIQKFFLALPAKHYVERKSTNLVSLAIRNQAKGKDHKAMAQLIVSQRYFIINVIIPFFDSLTWLSKKVKDYIDWKLILDLINQGWHFTEEGKKVICLITQGMNNYRLSTSITPVEDASQVDVKERALKLLSSPSNYEVQANGKIKIKSLGTYLKGRGNVGVNVLDVKGEIVFKFNSIKDCALFFNVHTRTINRRLENGSLVEYNNQNFVFQREMRLP